MEPSRRQFLIAVGLSATPGCAQAPARPARTPIRPLIQPPDDPDPGRLIPPEELQGIRDRIIEAHNTIRAKVKLGKLVPSRKLTLAAQAHAEDMAARRKMSHTGGDGTSPADRVKGRGYRYRRVGENVAYGHFTEDRVMKGWMESRHHKDNILGGFTEIGVGCAVGEDGKRYWCVNFGLPATR